MTTALLDRLTHHCKTLETGKKNATRFGSRVKSTPKEEGGGDKLGNRPHANYPAILLWCVLLILCITPSEPFALFVLPFNVSPLCTSPLENTRLICATHKLMA
jgi:hypothetical protein